MISLVVATIGRRAELEALLASLVRQSEQDFEVVLVDQNLDDLLAPVVARFARELALTRVRLGQPGLSRARNLGISCARGEVVGFPDDDCLYPPELLARVAARFSANPDLELLSGPAIDPGGRLSSGRWTRRSGRIRMATVWTSVIAFNCFVGRPALARVGGFDEELGVGARFGAAEETDLAIRVLRTGRAEYDFGLRAIHPHKPAVTARAFAYGTGLGRVLRRQRASATIVAMFLVRPLGGIAASLLRGRIEAARYYWQTLRGRLSGFLAHTP